MNISQILENDTIKYSKTLIKSAIYQIFENNYHEPYNLIFEAQRLFQEQKSQENISICLSLLGLLDYMKDKNKYLKALTYINDGKYLANYGKNISATIINELAIAEIESKEKNIDSAITHLKNAQKMVSIVDEYEVKHFINDKIKKLQKKKNKAKKGDPLVALLKIGQTVSAETNIDNLLKVIAEETKNTIQADRCSVFLYDKEHNQLWSKIALGMDSEEIRFPADKGLAGHVVQTGETINIKNAYTDDRFNKEIDLQTGYKTTTILCMPIKNLNQEIIGAFQVLNKLDGDFSEEDEDLLVAIGSSAGIALENAQLFEEQKAMFIEQKQVFDSFIDTLATSIDARDKITAGHSIRVKMYSSLIAKALNLDEKNVEIIEKAATLHDIGKIGIRDSVLQKQGKLTDEEYEHIQKHVEITNNILEKIHMSDEFKMVTEIARTHHEKYDGSGYYRKLAGEEIPLGGRILAVSDVFDAITSKRHYRDKMPIIEVINILIKSSGNHFDKNIVDCFLALSTNKLINVFLTENYLFLDEEHKKILESYSLINLYNLSIKEQSEELSEEEKVFIDLFNLYYTSKSNKEESY